MKKQAGYIKHYYCPNCDYEFNHEHEYGTIARQPKCPRCGVSPNDLRRPMYESDMSL